MWQYISIVSDEDTAKVSASTTADSVGRATRRYNYRDSMKVGDVVPVRRYLHV